MSCTVTMTREQQVSRTTQQVPQAINADRVRSQRQQAQHQRDYLVNSNFRLVYICIVHMYCILHIYLLKNLVFLTITRTNNKS